MFDQRLTTEQIEFRDTMRDFVRREVKPVVLHPDRLQAVPRRLPLELIELASQLGLRTLELSESAGGAGADTLTACIVLEELGAGDVDLAVTLAETSRVARTLFDGAMSDAQREKFLPEFLADHNYHFACAAIEPDAEMGWGYHRPSALKRGVEVTAVRSGSEWIVNGTASYVANAPLAKLFAVCVRTITGARSTVLVPRDTIGLDVRDHRDAANAGVAWYHGARGTLVFDQCRVPLDNTLSEQGHARVTAEYQADGHGGPQQQAINIGVGRAALEAAVDYTKLRVQGGRPIVGHQAIGTILADAAVRLEAARSIVWRAAWAADHPDAYRESGGILPLQTVAKVYTSEAVHEAAEGAAECFGAMGVMRDMPLQKYLHDALVFIDSGTSNRVARFRIAEALTGYERPDDTAVRGEARAA